MNHKEWANAVLGFSLLTALASAPFRETLPVDGLFHLSFAAAVGGMADWFGVTSLFRKPLGLSKRTDLIAGKRDEIVCLSKDMVKEVLGPSAFRRLLTQHEPAAVIQSWLFYHRPGVEKLLRAGALLAVESVDRKWLSSLFKEWAGKGALDLDWAGIIAHVMKVYSAYPGKRDISLSLAAEVQVFLEDELTEEEIRKIYLDAWRRYRDEKTLGGIARWVMKSRDEFVISIIQKKIRETAASIGNPKSPLSLRIGEEYDAWQQKLEKDEEIRKKVNDFIGSHVTRFLTSGGAGWLEKLWDKNKETLADQLAKSALAMVDKGLRNDHFRRDFDAFIIHRVLSQMDWIHEEMDRAVEMKMSEYDGRKLSELAEKGVSEDVAVIRLNGSFFGALLGLLFFLVSLAGGAL